MPIQHTEMRIACLVKRRHWQKGLGSVRVSLWIREFGYIKI